MLKGLKEKIISIALTTALSVSFVPAFSQPVNAAEPQAINGVVYGTINMHYDDFYYGDVANIEPKLDELSQDDLTPKFDENQKKLDYDAVTSATDRKSTMYSTAWFEKNNIPEGITPQDPDNPAVRIHGIKDVQIAIPEKLYNNIKEGIDNNKPCNNNLKEVISKMTPSDKAFDHYKVLQNDGTFSKVKTGNNVIADAQASISTKTPWGTHQLNIKNLPKEATTDNILGILLETSDGKVAGMQHADNIWLRTAEIAFCTKEGFKEPHGNLVNHKNAKGLEGKTIKKIIYLLKDKNLVINCDLKVHKTVDKNAKISSEKAEFSANESVVTGFNFENLPQDSNYILSEIIPATGKALISESDYNYKEENKQLEITNKKAGKMVLNFKDKGDEYQELSTELVIHSPLKSDDISLNDNKLTIKGGADELENYMANISKIKVDKNEIRSKGKPAKIIFDKEGNINWNAKVGKGENAKPIFAQGSDGKYEITLEAYGYPDVILTAGKINPLKAFKTIKLTKSNYTYTGKNIRPAVTVTDSKGKVSSKNYTVVYNKSSKKPGRYSVKVTMKKPYKGSKTLYYTVSPKKTSLKVSKVKKNSFIIKWAKVIGISKYQIRYATNKKFKKPKFKTVKASGKSFKLSKLSTNKKYYVTIRSYTVIKINNKNIKLYSPWAKIKVQKTKKR